MSGRHRRPNATPISALGPASKQARVLTTSHGPGGQVVTSEASVAPSTSASNSAGPSTSSSNTAGPSIPHLNRGAFAQPAPPQAWHSEPVPNTSDTPPPWRFWQTPVSTPPKPAQNSDQAQDTQPIPDAKPSKFDMDDDVEDVVLTQPESKSGMGQNEMLTNWAKDYGDSFMRAMHWQYAPLSKRNSKCSCGAAAEYKCHDCPGPRFQCKTCIVAAHSCAPTHRIQQWALSQLVPGTLKLLGYRFALGEHSEPCPTGMTRDLILGSMEGFQTVPVVYCGCSLASQEDTKYQQLLDARI
ncbi:hypothetical protein FRC12_010624 [Ceratobasidium sp. 428]|nr:hypothetical protein FRC12_010624 [Ceratobasidium sp. 428]